MLMLLTSKYTSKGELSMLNFIKVASMNVISVKFGDI